MCLVDCGRCGATGFLPEFSHVQGGVCFDCKGAKWVHGELSSQPMTAVHRLQIEPGVERCFAEIGNAMLIWDSGIDGVQCAESMSVDDAREWWLELVELGCEKLPSTKILNTSLRSIRKARNAWMSNV